jgi:hypothetical protein
MSWELLLKSHELTDDAFDLFRRAKSHAETLENKEKIRFEKKVVNPLEKVFAYLR